MSYTIASSCIACGDCRNVCPDDSAIVPGDTYAIDPGLCVACGVCADACPTSSIYEPRASHAELQLEGGAHSPHTPGQYD